MKPKMTIDKFEINNYAIMFFINIKWYNFKSFLVSVKNIVQHLIHRTIHYYLYKYHSDKTDQIESNRIHEKYLVVHISID